MSVFAFPLLLALLGPPEGSSEPPPEPLAESSPPLLIAPRQPELRARRMFIGAGTLMGIAFVGEVAGAIVSTTCKAGDPCDLQLVSDWGPEAENARYGFSTNGIGSAYVLSRGLAIPLVWSAKGLLALGAQSRAIADRQAGVVNRIPKWLGWTLLSSGLTVWAATRLARVGFEAGGVCQDPACWYTFDLMTLGVSRGLSSSGSALLMHRRTQRRVVFGVAPTAGYGLSLTGMF